MVEHRRHFDHSFPEYNGETLLGPDKELTGKLTADIEQFLTCQLKQLEALYKDAIKRKKFDSSHDSIVYTGTSGIILLAQKMQLSKWKDLLVYHEVLLTKISLRKKRITFLCGDAGPLVLKGLDYNSSGDGGKTDKYIKELIQLASWSSEEDMYNEVLYGRAGYLYALLRMKQVSKDLVPDSVIQNIVSDIIKAGIKGKKKQCSSSLPLYYEWHEKEYIGAAHGYIGIFYMLLQANVICPGVLKQTDEDLVVSSLDALLNLRFPSGNMPSSMGSENDRLIHWCHGAPGAIHLYALAYKLYQNPTYLSACRGFADTIWTRGLLRKGYGLCHGVAGNGYSFLCMYQLTGELDYLWKSTKFAEWCLSYGEHGCRTPDTPYSMFEGLAGTLHFLYDMLTPMKAMFPAFQLVSYSANE